MSESNSLGNNYSIAKTSKRAFFSKDIPGCLNACLCISNSIEGTGKKKVLESSCK